jgi:excisionase family DNA binding protein
MSAASTPAQVAVSVPDELVEHVAERAAELLREASTPCTGWLSVDEAAAHLRCPRSRIYRLVHLGRIPHEHEGSRLLFDRAALDEWIREGGAS